MDEQLIKIRQAYNRTVAEYNAGVDPREAIPKEFRNSDEYKSFMAEVGTSCGSGSPGIREWLRPRTGMRFLDGGCCANLANYRLDRWPCTYYGVDISPALMEAMV